MTEKMNKIQIRAEVFSSLNSVLFSNENNSSSVNIAIERLKKIKDKDFLAKILIKEFVDSKDSERSALITIMLLNCVPLEEVEKYLWSNIALKTVSDEKKYQLIDILKSMGKFIEYENYLDYFDEPQKVIDADTQRLLSSALLNPEAQIDFLDFMETLSSDDKFLLIQSMIDDYSSDDLSNIISPIIFCEKDKRIIEKVITELAKTKSALSYYPLKRFTELSKDESLKKLANKGLKELKIAGVNEKKAIEYYSQRFKNSILYNCYVSIPDGKGNIGLIFSRIHIDNSIQMFCVVINDIHGVTDCFGFSNISSLEFSLIIKNFSGNNEPYSLTFDMGLKWLNEAEKLSDILPYEYICWKEILFDVVNSSVESDDIIKEALNILPKKECDLEEILSWNILSKLFFVKNDNPELDKLIKEIDENIFSSNEFNLKEIENYLKDNLSVVFDKKTKDIFIKRLQKISFILMSNSKNTIASKIYELSRNENLLDAFLSEVLKKSLFVFYQQEFQNKINTPKDNIFAKKSQRNNTKLEHEKIQELLECILDKWGKDE